MRDAVKRLLVAGSVAIAATVTACEREPTASARSHEMPSAPATTERPAPILSATAAASAPAVVAPDILEGRPFAVHTPAAYEASDAMPLVVFLHGLGASGQLMERALHVPVLSEQLGFLYVAPEGTLDSKNRRFWNASAACCNFDRRDVDDVAYLRALIAHVKKTHRVDDKRVYVVGYSNGGFMAHRLACEMSELAGIVSVAGSISVGDVCKPSASVAVLQVHGDADTAVRYDGGFVLGNRAAGAHSSARETVAGWAERNGCKPQPVSLGERDLEDKQPGAETTALRWEQCRGGAAELWTVRGGSHFVGQTRRSSQAMLEFLLKNGKR